MWVVFSEKHFRLPFFHSMEIAMSKSVKENVETLVTTLNEALEDATKFTDKGNKAAGTRVRKALLDVSKACKEIRQQVTNEKNA